MKTNHSTDGNGRPRGIENADRIQDNFYSTGDKQGSTQNVGVAKLKMLKGEQGLS
jgi:hypothetical protein